MDDELIKTISSVSDVLARVCEDLNALAASAEADAQLAHWLRHRADALFDADEALDNAVIVRMTDAQVRAELTNAGFDLDELGRAAADLARRRPQVDDRRYSCGATPDGSESPPTGNYPPNPPIGLVLDDEHE